MLNIQPYRVKSISEYHQLRGLGKPEHPLISVINYTDIIQSPENNKISWVHDFYFIALKKNINTKIRYGQQDYDFDEGVMFFIAPGQVFKIEVTKVSSDRSGWFLLIHPDFFWNFPLAISIRKYEYFGYLVHEALFLSQKEEDIISHLMQDIQREYLANIDTFSQQIIVSHIEVLLNYADRFYHRQFITRRIANDQILTQVETLLNAYFDKSAVDKGLPTVQDLAGQMNVSPDYLSTLLRITTGQNTQQHIHDKLIERAKQRLSTTSLSVSQIAYELGFEHSQSFSKLFKTKTRLSPLEFRKSLN